MEFDIADKRSMRRSLALFLVLLCSLASVAGAKKTAKPIVRFYGEVAESNGDVFGTPIPLLDGSGSVRVSKVATVSERDIVAFTPFQNADGSFGAYFFLDDHGKLLLETLSVESRGKMVIALVNGRHVADLLIDKKITDGIAMIPSGLTPQDIDLFRKNIKLRESSAAVGKKI
jgi:hypothetical protein